MTDATERREEHGQWVQRTCEHCGASFHARRAYIAIGKGRFCSKRCGYAAQTHSITDHLWSYVDRVTTPDGCWLWTGSLNNKGYGNATRPGGNAIYAHRLSWEIHNGPIPEGLWVLHNCPAGDNPACVNPAHLWLGTAQQNSADMVAKGRHVFHQHPERAAHGERNNLTTLTEGRVVEMRSLHALGRISMSELAKLYGIHSDTARRIVQRKSWRSI